MLTLLVVGAGQHDHLARLQGLEGLHRLSHHRRGVLLALLVLEGELHSRGVHGNDRSLHLVSLAAGEQGGGLGEHQCDHEQHTDRQNQLLHASSRGLE